MSPAVPESASPASTTSQPAHAGGPPPVILVMGVSGSGKTTVGNLLAQRLGWRYAEADDFHPAANVAKMAAGHPLDDADREPWLEAIGAWIDEVSAAGEPAVVTCSALKHTYREILRTGRPQVRVVYLDVPFDVVAARLSHREGHFFPARLLETQYRDLEPPAAEDGVLSIPVDAATTPERIVDLALALGAAR
ncbi:gluconokinase [Actinospica robiniae]|uniref:gluconokinase n=1 Tax=Actinospica robiniae TaxID=304901 RepID=UPI0004018639|nr:gluconokinase [Actinospica robiniae]